MTAAEKWLRDALNRHGEGLSGWGSFVGFRSRFPEHPPSSEGAEASALPVAPG